MKDSLFRDWDNGNKYVKAPYQGVLTTGNDWCSVFVDANSLAEDEFIIYNQDLSASSVNTVMKNTMIEIRVYN